MAGLVFFACIIWVFGGFFWYFIYEAKLRDALWSKLAERHQGQVYYDETRFGRIPLHVVCQVEGVEVKLDLHTIGFGKNAKTYTRTVARVNASPRLKAQVYKETAVFSALGKALGGQDVKIGDAKFDSTFIIKGNDEGWLQRKLGPHQGIRAHILRTDLRMVLEDGDVTLAREGESDKDEQLSAQVLLTAAYAQAFRDAPRLTLAPEPTPSPSSPDAPTHTPW